MPLTPEKCCRCKEYHLRVKPCSDGQPWHSSFLFGEAPKPDGPVPPGKSEVRSEQPVAEVGSPVAGKSVPEKRQVARQRSGAQPVRVGGDEPSRDTKSRQQLWNERNREKYNEYMRSYRAKRKGS